MKTIRVPPHTAQNFLVREISADEVQRTVQSPDAVIAGYEGRAIYMRRYHDAVLDQEMLLRVIVEESETELVIVQRIKLRRLRAT